MSIAAVFPLARSRQIARGSSPARHLRAAMAALAVLCAVAAPRPATAEEPFESAAPVAMLYDHVSGTTLYEKDADRQVAPGNLVKIMTAAVVFEDLRAGRITLATPFVVSPNAWRKGGGPSGGAAMFAEVNKPVSVGDLLKGALVVSGNDAAMTLAEGVAGSEGAFAQKMNEMGKALGLSASVFRNSTGFADPDQVMSARDVVHLASAVIRTYPEYYPIFATPGIDWNKIKQRNRNPLLEANVGADGLQAAWLRDAGYHLAGSAVQGDRRLIAVVMGARNEKERLEETKKLLEWGFSAFQQRELAPAGKEVARARVFGGTARSVGLAPPAPVLLLSPKAGGERLTFRVTYEAPLRAPVAQGAQVAQLTVLRGRSKVLDVPLVTTEAVPPGGLLDRALDGALALVGDTAREAFTRVMAKFSK